MNSLQFSWIFIGFAIGVIMLIPIKRCLATHNGLLSMLIASIMGIFNVGAPFLAVLAACFFFTYGMYQNQHKYFGTSTGEAHHDKAK
ncbi:hypothetical protein [Acinetobacter sp. CFCC 10889]|uniref:hypothetical protein n=1 Tax=Acinetobacter sp. CFCC 10889 TaxID=1775557 RepID=UPI000DCFDC2A|nr:hypothetical protein [Acinetobacter sp. CFCC 10889]